MQRRAGARRPASPARPASAPRRRRSRPGRPVAVRSRSAEQRDEPRRRAAARQQVGTARSPPVSGRTSMPERLAVGEEPLVERLGLEPLGDGDDRPVRRRSPRRRRGPSCPCAAARRPRRARPPARRRAGGRPSATRSRTRSVRGSSRQPEHVAPVAQVGPHAPRETAPDVGVGGVRPDDPAQVRLEPLHAARRGGAHAASAIASNIAYAAPLGHRRTAAQPAP